MKDLIGYKHGVNLGGWFSQCDYSLDRFDNFIKEKDFKNISELSFDHVRIPVDFNLVQNDDYSFKEDGFQRIEKCIELCKKYNLNMVLDLHKTIGFSFDKKEKEEGFFNNKEYQENFYTLWLEFTKRFSKYENILAFELLNEVTEYEYKDSWNLIATECIKRIRKIAPTIKILVGGYYNNAVCAVKDIDIPFDENIILNFHCYEPLIFTHQGAYWIDKMDTNFKTSYDITFKQVSDLTNQYIKHIGMNYDFMDPNEKIGSHYFETIFKEAIEYANDRNVPLYCGEYGVIDKADINDTLSWYQDIQSVFNKYNIGHALWSYKEMDFGLMDSRMEPIRNKITN